MTNRSRGVLKTRCSAMVNSTTPKFGPRCPPVWERTLISSSRTSCASCGRSCSRSAFTSAGEWIPSSSRAGAAPSEKSDFIGLFSSFIDRFVVDLCFRCRFKLFHDWFAGAVVGDDFDLLLGADQSFLPIIYQITSLYLTYTHIFSLLFDIFYIFLYL